jgi:CheY-like chemotaxis protein
MFENLSLKKVKALYAGALILIASMSTFYFYYINSKITEIDQYASIINLAGRQRMLSQRTVLFAKQDKGIYQTLKEQMLQENEIISCKEIPNLCDVKLDQSIKQMMQEHFEVLDALDSEFNTYVEFQLTTFLKTLNERVQFFEDTSNRKNSELRRAESFILMLILLTLGLEFIFIFRPILNNLSSSINQLNRSNAEISLLLKNKKTILDDLAHNINNPLNRVLNLSSNADPDLKKQALELKTSVDFFIQHHQGIENDFVFITSIKQLLNKLVKTNENISFSIECPLQEINILRFKQIIYALLEIVNIKDAKYKIVVLEPTTSFYIGGINGESFKARLDKGHDILHQVIQESLQAVNGEIITSNEGVEILIPNQHASLTQSVHKIENILIVDDDKMNQIVLKKAITGEYNIDIANDGTEAIERVQTKDYDLIFMDIRMPVLSGHDATKKIRALKKNAHIVMVSANSSESDYMESFKSGANSFVAKPINTEQIQEEIEFAQSYFNQNKYILLKKA